MRNKLRDHYYVNHDAVNENGSGSDNKRIYAPKIMRMFQTSIWINIHIRNTFITSIEQD